MNGYNQTIGSLSDGGVTPGGTITSSAGGTPVLTVGGLNSNSTFSGVIQNGSATVALAKVGGGALTLTGANTYTGGTTVSGGSLQLGDGVTTNGSVVGNINLNNNSSVVFANPSAQAYGGVVSGNGSLTKTGGGMLTLPTAQTYSGAAEYHKARCN